MAAIAHLMMMRTRLAFVSNVNRRMLEQNILVLVAVPWITNTQQYMQTVTVGVCKV